MVAGDIISYPGSFFRGISSEPEVLKCEVLSLVAPVVFKIETVCLARSAADDEDKLFVDCSTLHSCVQCVGENERDECAGSSRDGMFWPRCRCISCLFLFLGVSSPSLWLLCNSFVHIVSYDVASQDYEKRVLRTPKLKVLPRVYEVALAKCAEMGDAQLALEFFDVSWPAGNAVLCFFDKREGLWRTAACGCSSWWAVQPEDSV